MKRVRKIKSAVTQEHPMGCGLACVAYLVDESYKAVLSKVKTPKHAWTRGFYCPDLVALLETFGSSYEWKKVTAKFSMEQCPNRTIVFVKPNDQYPMGHFLVKVGKSRYMNPWINFPCIAPAKSGFNSKIDRVSYIVIPKK